MQIVIDIPEEEYKCVQITGCIGNETCISNAIYDGTPLPKGHGRLIDAEAIYNDLIFPNEQFAKSFKDILDDAPTIIEPYKAESEDKE